MSIRLFRLSTAPELLTRAEVAKLLRVDVRSVDRWVAVGLLQSSKLAAGKSGRRVFSLEDVEDFVRGGAQSGVAP